MKNNKEEGLEVFEVTEEDYKQELADGVEDPLKPGKHYYRRGRPRDRYPDLDMSDRKVKITIWMDSYVIEHFKKLAEKPGSAGYQTLINEALKERIAATQPEPRQDLLNDDAFIAAVAERVTRLRSGRHRGHAAKRARRSSS